MRVIAYVDSLNLYYRALRNTPYKWLNVGLLAQNLVQSGEVVEKVKFFTARVSGRGNEDAPARQNVYLKALSTVSDLDIYYGRMVKKKKYRPLEHYNPLYVSVSDTEEKGTDVSLAVHMVNDGWKDLYDVALLLSNDTDLLESMRIVREEIGKKLGVIWLDGKRPSPRFIAQSDFLKHLTPSDLNKAQFPRCLSSQIIKPVEW